MNYDAILVTSFGGPEGPADVMPFLENVLRGKNVPRERMLQVAEHYYRFGGKSPINDQNRRLIAALEAELAEHGPRLPVYWGNRNWYPLLADTMRQMKKDGVRRALAFVTSAYRSYSGCRQYRENIARAGSRRTGRPGRRQDSCLSQSPRVYRNSGRSRSTGAIEVSGRSARGGATHLHGAQHSAGDGAGLRLREAVEGDRPAGRGGAAPRELAVGVPEPQRPRFTAVAGARHSRLPSRLQGSRRLFRCVDRAHRLRLRSHGDSLRPRHPGARTLRRVGAANGAGGDGGHPSQVHSHD